MITLLLIGLIAYAIIGLGFSVFLLFVDKAFNFDSQSKTWLQMFSEYQTYLMILLVLIFWPVLGISFLVSMFRDR